MGQGYILQCGKCDYRINVSLGIGFLYPNLCEEILSKMKQGNYGEALQKAARKTPGASIHAENALFHCKKCGALKSDGIVQLCAPKKLRRLKRRVPFSVVNPVTSGAYVMRHEIGSDYTVVGEIPHPCENCGQPMQPVEEASINDLQCPKCKAKLAVVGTLCWD